MKFLKVVNGTAFFQVSKSINPTGKEGMDMETVIRRYNVCSRRPDNLHQEIAEEYKKALKAWEKRPSRRWRNDPHP